MDILRALQQAEARGAPASGSSTMPMARNALAAPTAPELAGPADRALRDTLLTALRDALLGRPDARLLLIYHPGFDDPFGLRAEAQREVATVRWGRDRGYTPELQPRLVELDCRRVAAYLLETHPGLDDPLLDTALTQATHEAARVPDPGGDHLGPTIGGWLVSREPAATVAFRLSEQGRLPDLAARASRLVNWFDGRIASLLWPLLDPARRQAVLASGETWVGIDAVGAVFAFQSTPTAAPVQPPSRNFWSRADASEWLVDFLARWREQGARTGEALPADAGERAARRFAQARAAGLDGPDLLACVSLAVRLPPSSEPDPALIEAMQRAAAAPGTFADHARELPAALLRHLHPHVQGGTHVTPV